jgi:hypothetical protein
MDDPRPFKPLTLLEAIAFCAEKDESFDGWASRSCPSFPCGICSGPGAQFQAGKQGCGSAGRSDALTRRRWYGCV